MTNAFQVVRDFEKTVAEYAGSKYAISIDSCSHALFLCCLYCNIKDKVVTIPKHTYISVPNYIMHAGGRVEFEDLAWSGIYQLKPFPIWDSAKRFRRDMYIPGSFYCLSFHIKKILGLTRGGTILTDSQEAYEWFKLMRFDGRNECSLTSQKEFKVLGYNFYMSPDIAAMGLWRMNSVQDWYDDQQEIPNYPDLSKLEIFKT